MTTSAAATFSPAFPVAGPAGLRVGAVPAALRRIAGKSVGIEGVTKRYGRVAALADVSLTVEPGEFCTILGASGSGKSTLLKVVAGFEPFESGHILLGGRDVGDVPAERRNIGMVFQNYALFPHMTVRRNVAFGLEMRRLPRAEIDARVDEALALVDMAACGDALPAMLSGGQQQRVGLARALVVEPDILLMDEPLGALDRNLRASIQIQLKRLHASLGVTVIYVTHDQEEALHLSDRIVVMDGGRVLQQGSPRDVYFRPSTPFVAGFLGECNLFRDAEGRECGVRPENVRVERRNGAAPAAGLPGTVEMLMFLGSGLKVVARSGDRQIVAVVPADAVALAMRPGDEVTLSFDERDVHRFG